MNYLLFAKNPLLGAYYGMVRFGPSGNDILFYQEGHKSTVQAPAWLKKLGLSAFEYNFGRGIRLSEKLAAEIGSEAAANGIRVSAHAPYFINLASSDSVAIQKSYGYIERSLKLLNIMGGQHLVVHVGSQGELTREQAMQNVTKNLKWVTEELKKNGIDDYRLCLETMGRFRAIGDCAEICELCKIDSHIIPTLDFGHINCLLRGGLTHNPEKMREVLEFCIREIGIEKMKEVHIHFSAVIYTQNGERAHTTLDDKKFGIPFAPLGRAVKDLGLEPTIICESSEIMAQDALKLLEEFKRC